MALRYSFNCENLGYRIPFPLLKQSLIFDKAEATFLENACTRVFNTIISGGFRGSQKWEFKGAVGNP
jgi:hypothetical protein